MKKLLVIFLCCLVAGYGCRNRAKTTRTDTHTSGIAVFVADEGLGNVVQELVDVFEAQNQEASLIPIFTNEGEALDLLLKDSVRLAILARDITEAEAEHIRSIDRELRPRTQRIAIDGIALIVHNDNPLSLISLQSIQRVMTGEVASWDQLDAALAKRDITVVFDAPNSSTARFIRDSILMGGEMSDRLFAAQNNIAVLNYVTENPGALGIIGVNWISNPNDSSQLAFRENIKVLSVSKTHPATEESSFQPVPAFLYLRDYPLTRDVYAILTDLRGTLPAGFSNFIGRDNGQRIVLRSGLVPATMPLRTIEAKESY